MRSSNELLKMLLVLILHVVPIALEVALLCPNLSSLLQKRNWYSIPQRTSPGALPTVVFVPADIHPVRSEGYPPLWELNYNFSELNCVLLGPNTTRADTLYLDSNRNVSPTSTFKIVLLGCAAVRWMLILAQGANIAFTQRSLRWCGLLTTIFVYICGCIMTIAVIGTELTDCIQWWLLGRYPLNLFEWQKPYWIANTVGAVCLGVLITYSAVHSDTSVGRRFSQLLSETPFNRQARQGGFRSDVLSLLVIITIVFFTATAFIPAILVLVIGVNKPWILAIWTTILFLVLTHIATKSNEWTGRTVPNARNDISSTVALYSLPRAQYIGRTANTPPHAAEPHNSNLLDRMRSGQDTDAVKTYYFMRIDDTALFVYLQDYDTIKDSLDTTATPTAAAANKKLCQLNESVVGTHSVELEPCFKSSDVEHFSATASSATPRASCSLQEEECTARDLENLSSNIPLDINTDLHDNTDRHDNVVQVCTHGDTELLPKVVSKISGGSEVEVHERDVCLVCLENGWSVILDPCGHGAICRDCIELMLARSVRSSKVESRRQLSSRPKVICPLCRAQAHKIFDTSLSSGTPSERQFTTTGNKNNTIHKAFLVWTDPYTTENVASLQQQ